MIWWFIVWGWTPTEKLNYSLWECNRKAELGCFFLFVLFFPNIHVLGMAYLKCLTFHFFMQEQVDICWNTITFYKSAILLIIVVAATLHQQLSFMIQQAQTDCELNFHFREWGNQYCPLQRIVLIHMGQFFMVLLFFCPVFVFTKLKFTKLKFKYKSWLNQKRIWVIFPLKIIWTILRSLKFGMTFSPFDFSKH